jgi:hypothetical protein
MGFDVMSLNDPFIEFMWIRVNNDDSIARNEANIGQLESMSSKCAIKMSFLSIFMVIDSIAHVFE